MATIAEQRHELQLRSEALFRSKSTKRQQKIIAEGDSWFAYPLVLDVIEQLRRRDYAVKRVSVAGDTLENMVYGTKTSGKGPGQRNDGCESLEKTLKLLDKFEPRFVLFSGGGNDIVGDDMMQFLNHKRSGLPILDEPRFKAHVEGSMRTAIEHFLNAIWEKAPEVDILMDGYAYAKPNGKGYKVGVRVTGPWVRPNFIKKGWDKRAEHMEPTVKRLVDIYNDMLATLAAKHERFHYINLRPWFLDEDEWHNEIHLKGEGYKMVAEEYHRVMQEILVQANEEVVVA